MKIATISDLHVDVNRSYPVKDVLASLLRSSGSGMLLIAGDISERFDITIRWVEELEELAGIPVRYVPGNHDLWRACGVDNDGVYSRYVRDPRCLCGKSMSFGNWVVVGDAGWYDYTLSPMYGEDVDFDAMSYDGRIWQDKIRNSWSSDNRGRLGMMLSNLERILCEVEGRDVIAVTHMLVNDDFIVRGRGPGWDYFNAFLGSSRLGELFKDHHVRYSVSGHVHFRKTSEHDGTVFICPCLGYCSEWGLYSSAHAYDISYQISDSLHFIEI